MEPLATYFLEEIADCGDDCTSGGSTQKVADSWMESAYFTRYDLHGGTQVCVLVLCTTFRWFRLCLIVVANIRKDYVPAVLNA